MSGSNSVNLNGLSSNSNAHYEKEKKAHQNKIASQLKKYMNETEQTSQAARLDQNYRDMLN